jgi:hypothetical protein
VEHYAIRPPEPELSVVNRSAAFMAVISLLRPSLRLEKGFEVGSGDQGAAPAFDTPQPALPKPRGHRVGRHAEQLCRLWYGDQLIQKHLFFDLLFALGFSFTYSRLCATIHWKVDIVRPKKMSNHGTKNHRSSHWVSFVPVIPRLTTYVDWFVDMSEDRDPVFSFTLLPMATGRLDSRATDPYAVREGFFAIRTPHEALLFFREFGPYRVIDGEVRYKLDQFAEELFQAKSDGVRALQKFRAQQQFLSDLMADRARYGEFHATAVPISFSALQVAIESYQDALVNWGDYWKAYMKAVSRNPASTRLQPGQTSDVVRNKVNDFREDPRIEAVRYLRQNIPMDLIFERQEAVAHCRDVEDVLRVTICLDNLNINNPSRLPWRRCAREDCRKIFRCKKSRKQKFCDISCSHLHSVRCYNLRKQEEAEDAKKHTGKE